MKRGAPAFFIFFFSVFFFFFATSLVNSLKTLSPHMADNGAPAAAAAAAADAVLRPPGEVDRGHGRRKGREDEQDVSVSSFFFLRFGSIAAVDVDGVGKERNVF